MFYVVTDEKDVVIYTTLTVDEVEGTDGDIKMDNDVIIPRPYYKNYYEIEDDRTRQIIVPLCKYCFTEEKGLYRNPNYNEFTEEERIIALEEAVNSLLGM